MSDSTRVSAFFLQHKELFEFDKYVGGGPITASTLSFLSRHRECERLQVMETAQLLNSESITSFRLEPTLPLSTTLPLPTSNLPSNHLLYAKPTISSVGNNGLISSQPQHYYASPPSPSRSFHGNIDPRSLSLQTNLHDNHYSRPTELQHQARSPQRRMPSPQRSPQRFSHAPEHDSPFSLPKLSDLLIDASSRAVMPGLGKSKQDEAKKIELLIGSTCVGRASAASNLPPAIRRRVLASADVQKRRESLYLLLKSDYERVCGK